MLYVNELLYNLKIRKYITRKLEKKNDYSSMPIKFYDCMPKGFSHTYSLSYFIFLMHQFPFKEHCYTLLKVVLLLIT